MDSQPAPGLLDYATFARFIDQAAPSLARVCFAGRGEPTLNPETQLKYVQEMQKQVIKQVESIITADRGRKQCAR